MIHRSPSLLSVILVLLHLALVMSTFKSSLHPVKCIYIYISVVGYNNEYIYILIIKCGRI
ncbi:hypothetical protein HanRHA438_Chr11g0508751 [Helianthus annuus]|nr:hypothetical protein HanIR_Chr11g0534201 [Helianthus annuus]KAJ0871138.1 hypothetical protein HanRHA438_Chr11g0508751 [Helianthus annuus]